jgi:hypothetical protein
MGSRSAASQLGGNATGFMMFEYNLAAERALNGPNPIVGAASGAKSMRDQRAAQPENAIRWGEVISGPEQRGLPLATLAAPE